MSKRLFIDDDFLLQNNRARTLYHEVAADLPIIDYHCHLPPEQIAEDTTFRNLTHIWLDGDHYKWRAMRTCGVSEERITGGRSDREKFQAWAETVPKTLRNPLYHWTHLELKRPFGVTQLLNGASADEIWKTCNEKLETPEFSARGLLKQFKVEVVATTDDPTDRLEHHQAIRDEGWDEVRVVPTFRPDRGMDVDKPEAFQGWVQKLEKASGKSINRYTDFLEALKSRHDHFHTLGCRASDHGVARPHSEPFNDIAIQQIFDSAMTGKSVSKHDAERFKSAFLYHCGKMDQEKGWVFQLHIGALRNNNKRMMKQLGRDSGFDSIGDVEMAAPLSRLLDRLDRKEELPRVILYNNNPQDNEVMVTMLGNFQDGSIPGKLQHGPPWWFLDQKDGIESQIEALSNMGILYEFVGMTTDSRSFLSWPRHDYFRRVVCNLLGADMEKGLIPDDPEMVGELVERICYSNARRYFRFGEGV